MAKILIVDDEPDIYQLIRRYAEHGGRRNHILALTAEERTREVIFVM